MNTSLSWLNRYLNSPIQADQVGDVLTQLGFPLDGRETVTLGSGGTDELFDVEVTSNRSDVLSHMGMAREIAAATNQAMKVPTQVAPLQATGEAGIAVQVDDAKACPVYTARLIRNVKVGPSPQWLVDVLEAVGLRSVNNVVDITNFVLLEVGQPLHAFDADKLGGKQIIVRRAAKDEQITAIDGSKHTLKPHMLVIADHKRPVAIAGVMGGLDTEVDDETQNILLESAAFDPLSVRRTSRALKLASDSSYRFERGVDPLAIAWASQRAAALIVEVAGGEIVGDLIRVGEAEPKPVSLTLRTQRCANLLGWDMPPQEQVQALERLQLSPVLEKDVIHCTIPTYRLDLLREVDLIEEVARFYGLDNVPVRERIEIVAKPVDAEQKIRQLLGKTMVGYGYHETITPSLLAKQYAKLFLQGKAALVQLQDDLRRADPFLRSSVVPSLLVCRKANQDMGNDNVRFYETASAWWHEADQESVTEQVSLAMLCDADNAEVAWREMRGLVEELLATLGTSEVTFEPAERPWLQAGAIVNLAGKPLGWMGLLLPKVVDAFDVQSPIMACELDWGRLLKTRKPESQIEALSRFPSIDRDLSVVVKEQTQWAAIEKTIHETSPAMLEAIKFVGTYRGKPIAKGEKSVTFRMVFRDENTTLRHEQVDPQVEAVVKALEQSVAATLRS